MSDKLAEQECDAWQAMEAAAANERNGWQDISDYVAPQKSAITGSKSYSIEEYADKIYDTEAVHSNSVLASGQMDYMLSGKWFECIPEDKDAPQDAKDWYKRAGETLLEFLPDTNFPLEMHEFFLDRGGFGTSHVHCEEDEEDIMYFVHAPIGTYYIQENHKKLVDTIRRCFKMDVYQAERFFGEENLSSSFRKLKDSKSAADKIKKLDVIHTIRPRRKDEREQGKIDAVNMPIASIYVCKEDKHTLRESGYPEQPFSVSRFERWGDTGYGWCPSHMVLFTIRQTQDIERDMDAVSEVQAFPRTLSPKGVVSKIRLEPAGVTSYDPNAANGAKPEFWGLESDIRPGLERAEQKREIIRRAYFVDLFQMLTNMDEVKREKTAFEVSKMLHEKLTRIHPTFERIKMEVFKPLLTRMFNIGFRANLFDDPPASVYKERNPGNWVIPAPKYSFTSKLAMAVRSAENTTFFEWWAMMAPIMEIMGPEAFVTELNFTRMIRMTGDNQGVSVDFFNSPEERKAIEAEIQAQKEAQAAMAMAESGSKVASNMSKLPQEIIQGGPPQRTGTV